MEGLFGNAIKLSEVTFRLIPEVLNAVDVVAFRGGEGLRVIDANMVISFDMEAVVTLERVTVDDAVGNHTFLDDGQQCLGLGVLNDLCVDLSSALQEAKHRHFPRSPATAFAFAPPAEVTLIDLHLTVERRLPLLMGGNRFPASQEEENCSIAVHSHHLSGSSCSCSSNKEFHQLARLTLREFASLEPHGRQGRRREFPMSAPKAIHLAIKAREKAAKHYLQKTSDIVAHPQDIIGSLPYIWKEPEIRALL